MRTGKPGFQRECHEWAFDAVGEAAATNIKERATRFLEEALELAQACGLTEANVNELAGYTFNRASGVIEDEIGGVMITLGALSEIVNVDMLDQGFRELRRVNRPEMIEKVSRKWATKPHFSVLPGKDA